MDNAGPDRRFGERGAYLVREALQAIDDDQQDVLGAVVPEFVQTRSQNLAPSFCSSQRPRISLVPSARTPSAIWTALVSARCPRRGP